MPRRKKQGEDPPQKAMKAAHQEVKDITEQLSSAREIYGPKNPIIKKLQGDSTAAVSKRAAAIRRLQGR